MENFTEEQLKEVDSQSHTGMKQAKASNGDIVRARVKVELPNIMDRLLGIINSPKTKTGERLKAIDIIMKYSVELPKQNLGVENSGTIKIIREYADEPVENEISQLPKTSD